MKIVASIQKNLRSLIGLPANFSPVAGLPLGEVQLPGSRPVTLVTAPAQPAAPVATGGPGLLVRQNPSDLSETIRAMATLRRASPSVRAQAVAARPAPRAKAAAAPAPASGTVDDKGNVPVETPPADDPVGDIVTQLEKCLKLLKEMNPDVNADDADADEAQALSALRLGNKAQALRSLDAAVSKWGAHVANKNARASAKNALFKNIRGSAQAAPLTIEANDSVETRRSKAASNMFRNIRQ